MEQFTLGVHERCRLPFWVNKRSNSHVSMRDPDSFSKGAERDSMTAVFTIKKNALKDLNGEEATVLFRGLLWCEARRVGLSPHNVVISLDTNVADGGVDARI